jgi:branched-chain amino acid transport system permease protein
MDHLVLLTLDGLARGAVYAAFGLALVLTWRGTRVVNFAQGALAVACAYVAHTVAAVTGSYWVGLAAAVGSGVVLGALTERLLRRARARPVDAVIAAVGLVLVIRAVLVTLYGTDVRPVGAPFARTPLTVAGVELVSPDALFAAGTVLAVTLLLLLFHRTGTGLAMRAVASAPEVARLLGVRAGRVAALGWALAGAVGAVAGVLALPAGPGLHPAALDLVFVAGFTAAVLGGLDRPLGAVVGGLAVGLVLSYAGAAAAPVAAGVLLVAAGVLRPAGLFPAART